VECAPTANAVISVGYGVLKMRHPLAARWAGWFMAPLHCTMTIMAAARFAQLIISALLCLPGINHALAEPFKVGVLLPLSGANAGFGSAAQNGITMAQEEGACPGDNLTLLFEDSEYDARKALAAYEKLRVIDKADLVYVWGSQPCLAAAPLAERHKLPLLCFSGDPKPKMRYVFSFNSPARDYSATLARYLQSRSKERWGLLQADMPFLVRTGTELQEHLGAALPPFVQKTVLPDALDFQIVASTLKRMNLSTLVLMLMPSQIGPFMRQAAGVGLKVQLLGSDTFSSTSAIKESHGLLEGALYADMDVSKEFQARYRRRFGSEDNLSFAANTYDLAFFLDELFREIPHGWPSSQVIERLAAVKTRSGRAAGSCTFVNDPDRGQFFRFQIGLRRIKGLDWEPTGF
jgi:branched-chain amino acid transport system substrate-binding protein